jgi:hypothetical protein|tara:strand:+ start:879 stop:1007 length:129 start_codon:yes stop_codon:yes gene_type:complete
MTADSAIVAPTEIVTHVRLTISSAGLEDVALSLSYTFTQSTS